MNATTEITRPVLVASSPVRGGRGVQELYYCPSGWYVAGSGVRWQDGNRWLSTCERDGASHGAYFTDETRAREHYAARITALPVCASCGKSTRSHTRPRYCRACGDALDTFAQKFATLPPKEI